ncbi:MAG: monofunctional biosynthetic peptidoglycan transglycosylase [Nitrospinales bacterium]
MSAKNKKKGKKRTIKIRIFIWLFDLTLCFVALTFIPVLLYRVIDPPTTPLMWIRWAQADYDKEFPRSIKRWRPIEEISPQLLKAVIASEDQKFFDHEGFDWRAVKYAIKNNLESKRKIGASTITMQTAKNVFLWQDRNWLRKGLEVYFTFLIELFWSKQRILEVYFNIIEWGDGVFGCEAASLKYFKKPVLRASPLESAWMAAILPNPRVWPENKYRSLVKKKQARILSQMHTVRLPKFVSGSSKAS